MSPTLDILSITSRKMPLDTEPDPRRPPGGIIRTTHPRGRVTALILLPHSEEELDPDLNRPAGEAIAGLRPRLPAELIACPRHLYVGETNLDPHRTTVGERECTRGLLVGSPVVHAPSLLDRGLERAPSLLNSEVFVGHDPRPNHDPVRPLQDRLIRCKLIPSLLGSTITRCQSLTAGSRHKWAPTLRRLL